MNINRIIKEFKPFLKTKKEAIFSNLSGNGQTAIFFDSENQCIVGTNSHIMLIKKAVVEKTKLLNIKGGEMIAPYPFYKVVFGKYNKELILNSKDILTLLNEVNNEFEYISFNIDYELYTVNKKYLQTALSVFKDICTLHVYSNKSALHFNCVKTQTRVLLMPINPFYVDKEVYSLNLDLLTYAGNNEIYDLSDADVFRVCNELRELLFDNEENPGSVNQKEKEKALKNASYFLSNASYKKTLEELMKKVEAI